MFHCGRFRFELTNPLVMGILNLTPDSFFDGGRYSTLKHAVVRARQMMDEGAAIIDVGGESTRPGALPVTPQEEKQRVLPVIEALVALSIPVSVDTRQPSVMQAAIVAGVDMINDISALQTEDALRQIAEADVAVCLMHMQGAPSTMQREPSYQDIVMEVMRYLADRVAVAVAAGIERKRLVVDPGFGFGKNLTHNLVLLRHLSSFRGLDVPLLAGLSRKSMLGQITGRDVAARLPASLAAVLAAVANGANIVRVHDVAATRDALMVWRAVEDAEG